MEKYPYSQNFMQKQIILIERRNQSLRERDMSRLQLFYKRILTIIDILGPYVQIMRILVTFIAPIVLMTMYIIHKSYRTKKIQNMIKNLQSDGKSLFSSQF